MMGEILNKFCWYRREIGAPALEQVRFLWKSPTPKREGDIQYGDYGLTMVEEVRGDYGVAQTKKQDAIQKTIMVDALGSGDAEESTGAKENFIGKVEFSNVSCDCEICEKGKKAMESQGQDYDTDYDHPASIKPLTEYEKNQNILGLNVSTSFGSKWMIFAGHVENLHGSMSEMGVEGLDDLADFLEGKVYEWRELTFTEDEDFTWEEANGGEGATYNIGNLFGGMENPPNEMLVPVRHIDDPDELAELGAEESADVEEVDF